MPCVTPPRGDRGAGGDNEPVLSMSPPPQTSTLVPRTASSARTTAASPTAGCAMGTTTAGTTRMSPTPRARVRSSVGGSFGGGWGGLFLTSPWVLTVLCLSVCPAQPGPAPPTSSPAPAGAASPSPGRATWMTTAGTARMNLHRVVSGGPSGVGSWGLEGRGGGSWLC